MHVILPVGTFLLGAQWGDEGKGKLTDILCAEASLCARAQGGNNAGHTIVANGETYDFHILPSGLVNPKCFNLIGTGCVVHIPSFFKELADLHKKNLDTTDRIAISDRAHIVFDLHLLIDGLQEGELTEAAEREQSTDGQNVVAKKSTGGAIGTTKKGIGPAYSDKYARSGVRIQQIFDKKEFDKRLRVLARGAQKRYGRAFDGYDVEEEIARFDKYREQLRPFVVDAVPLMSKAQQGKTNILVEGANALMLDINHGTYPFVTSSATGTGGAIDGLGLSPFKIKDIIGVVKAYTTRVGGGPFPTEALDDDGETLQREGHEFGVTTGRRRRCGWLDLVALKHSHAMNHYTALNLTKLDILDHFDLIRVGVAYRDPTRPDDPPMTNFPSDLAVLDRCEVVYKDIRGWKGEATVAGVKSYLDLPRRARVFIEFVEQKVGLPIEWVGTGAGREDMIHTEHLMFVKEHMPPPDSMLVGGKDDW
ncbi:MAG: hypothetical protein Q9169_007465 [Polycauliona sp. 2 TL-2023]